MLEKGREILKRMNINESLLKSILTKHTQPNNSTSPNHVRQVCSLRGRRRQQGTDVKGMYKIYCR